MHPSSFAPGGLNKVTDLVLPQKAKFRQCFVGDFHFKILWFWISCSFSGSVWRLAWSGCSDLADLHPPPSWCWPCNTANWRICQVTQGGLFTQKEIYFRGDNLTLLFPLGILLQHFIKHNSCNGLATLPWLAWFPSNFRSECKIYHRDNLTITWSLAFLRFKKKRRAIHIW